MTILIITIVLLFAAMSTGHAQDVKPLLKTQVETGYVEGVLDGQDLAVYKAIPYAAAPLGDLRDATRDIGFGWPAYAWTTLQKKTGKSPVYSAYLAQKSDTTVYAQGNRRGAAHADDMLYLKGAFDGKEAQYPQEAKVSELMQQYWVNFAKTGGNPNGEGLPLWPVFEEGKPTVMQFNNGTSLITTPNIERIQFIDDFMNSMRTPKTN